MEIEKTKLDKLLGFKYRNSSLELSGCICLYEEDMVDIIQKVDREKAIKLLKRYTWEAEEEARLELGGGFPCYCDEDDD
jgi:hypothetical protein